MQTDINDAKPKCNMINKKKNKLISAILYEKMIDSNYTLINGQLNQEKITQQSRSFTK